MDDNQVKAPASPGRIQIKDDEDVGHQPPKEYPTHPHKHVTSPVHEAARFVLDAGPNVAGTITPHHLLVNRNA